MVWLAVAVMTAALAASAVCFPDAGVQQPPFTRPCLYWGATKPEVKAWMQGHMLMAETRDELHFWGNEKELCLSYLFEDGGLVSSFVFLHPWKLDEGVVEDLLRGYVKVPGTPDTYVCLADSTMACLSSENGYPVFVWSYLKVSDAG